jgi:hypothetical protein
MTILASICAVITLGWLISTSVCALLLAWGMRR